MPGSRTRVEIEKFPDFPILQPSLIAASRWSIFHLNYVFLYLFYLYTTLSFILYLFYLFFPYSTIRCITSNDKNILYFILRSFVFRSNESLPLPLLTSVTDSYPCFFVVIRNLFVSNVFRWCPHPSFLTAPAYPIRCIDKRWFSILPTAGGSFTQSKRIVEYRFRVL